MRNTAASVNRARKMVDDIGHHHALAALVPDGPRRDRLAEVIVEQLMYGAEGVIDHQSEMLREREDLEGLKALAATLEAVFALPDEQGYEALTGLMLMYGTHVYGVAFAMGYLMARDDHRPSVPAQRGRVGGDGRRPR